MGGRGHSELVRAQGKLIDNQTSKIKDQSIERSKITPDPGGPRRARGRQGKGAVQSVQEVGICLLGNSFSFEHGSGMCFTHF